MSRKPVAVVAIGGFAIFAVLWIYLISGRAQTEGPRPQIGPPGIKYKILLDHIEHPEGD